MQFKTSAIVADADRDGILDGDENFDRDGIANEDDAVESCKSDDESQKKLPDTEEDTELTPAVLVPGTVITELEIDQTVEESTIL